MIRQIIAHRHLTWEMAQREIQERYVGHVFGSAWALAQPLLIMGVQIVIFTFVFRVSLENYPLLPFNYVSYVLAGLIPWYYFQEVLAKGCNAITNHAGLVKQVVFPVEILPFKTCLASFLTQLVATGFFLIYLLVTFRTLPPLIWLAPVFLFFEVLLMAGFGYFLAAVGVYLRDIREVVQTILMVIMYLLPVFYLPDMAPPVIRAFLWLNPFSYMIWSFQDVFYFGAVVHPWAWLVFGIESVVFFSLGTRLFMKVKILFGSQL